MYKLYAYLVYFSKYSRSEFSYSQYIPLRINEEKDTFKEGEIKIREPCKVTQMTQVGSFCFFLKHIINK